MCSKGVREKLEILRGDVYPNIMPRPWVRNSDEPQDEPQNYQFVFNGESLLPEENGGKWGEITY